MIALLRGEIADASPGSIIVECGGVGYQVFVSESALALLPPRGAHVELHTRQIVRENEISLYGFQSIHERNLFDALLTVSGLGPKIAMALIGRVGEEAAVAAILSDDWKSLTRAPGVGSKLAQRVCIELKEKVREDSLLGKVAPRRAAVEQDEVVEALVALGHKRNDAERAATKAREEAQSSDARTLIPLALKHAGR